MGTTDYTRNVQSGAATQRMLYDRKTAALQLSVSIRTIDYFLAAGKFKTRRMARRF